MKAKLPMNAALAWNSLGLKWLEMMAASTHVIAHRTSRNNTPAQWYGMGSEKISASLESSQAMARRMARLPTHDPLAMWNAWAQLLTSGMRPYHARALSNARSSRKRR